MPAVPAMPVIITYIYNIYLQFPSPGSIDVDRKRTGGWDRIPCRYTYLPKNLCIRHIYIVRVQAEIQNSEISIPQIILNKTTSRTARNPRFLYCSTAKK